MTVLRIIRQAEVAQHREALCRWLQANGLEPDRVVDRWFSIELVDGQRVIRYRQYKVTADGHWLVDPDDENRGWSEERTAALVVELDLPADELRSRSVTKP